MASGVEVIIRTTYKSVMLTVTEESKAIIKYIEESPSSKIEDLYGKIRVGKKVIGKGDLDFKINELMEEGWIKEENGVLVPKVLSEEICIGDR